MSRRAPLIAAGAGVLVVLLLVVVLVLPKVSAVRKANDALDAARTTQSELQGRLQQLKATEAQAQEILRPLADQFMAVSKCPDYVVNRGHYFGTGYDNEPALSNDDKQALIEFLKTF